MAGKPHDEDPKYGVVREVVTDYQQRGGAVVIPSHTGEDGGTLRRGPRIAKMVIDPGTPGEITVNSVAEGHRILSGGRISSPKPEPPTDGGLGKVTQIVQPETNVMPKKVQHVTRSVPEVPAKAKRQSGRGQISRVGKEGRKADLRPVVPLPVLPKPRHEDLRPANSPDALPTESRPEPSQRSADDNMAAVPPPEVEVDFTLPGGGKITAFYHHVLVDESANLLVLVYNREFKWGSLFVPPTTAVTEPDKLLTLQVGDSGSYTVGNLGIQFPFNNWEFIVLMIVSNKEEGV
jgi:hypothetical protein